MPRPPLARLALLGLALALCVTAWRIRDAGVEASRRAGPRLPARATSEEPEAAAPPASAAVEPTTARREARPAPALPARATALAPPEGGRPPSVRGTVVDDLGLPCAAFRLRAERLDAVERTVLERDFAAGDGRFALVGLEAGDWELVARSAEGLDSDPVAIAVPGPAAPRLIVPRAATVVGVVLGPDGTPAAGARVWSGDRPEVHADDSGAFRLGGLVPGVVALVARGRDLAPGPALALELLPGEVRADVVLRLRRGGRIVGDVVDASGAPERGVRVSASEPVTETETDDEGRFTLVGLAAGVQELRATTHAGLELSRRLVLAEGATEHFRLQPPADAPVLLHGRVIADGVESATEHVRAERMDEDGQVAACAVDVVQGRYALLLPGPGEVELSVELRPAGQAEIGWRDRADVPPVDDHEHDLVVPLGRVEGRVTDDQGVPLPGVLVETTPERHGREHGATRTRTTAGGRFTLTVAPGVHTVIAGARLGLAPGVPDDGQHTQARAEGVTVAAGAMVELADLVVTRGGTLEGTVVRADGSPASDVIVWSHAPGRTERLGRTEHGVFRLEGLPPGMLRLGAAGAGEATAAPVTCEITAGATTCVELQLAPATSVHVRAYDGTGALVGCDLEARDARGAAVALVRGTTGEAWLGPLPPGEYVVRAQRDGRRWERPFAVRGGGPELEIDLLLE